MDTINIDSKDEEEKKVDEEETTEATEETTTETEEETTTESKEEKTDYKVYGKETAEEARNMAEKMFNDVYSTLKSKQEDWNKTIDDYRANKPPVDLFEYDDTLVIKADLPRVTKDDISVKISVESVEIEVEFPDDIEDEENVKILRKERCIGKTKNIIPLPVEVNIDETKASFIDNELTITLPKVRGRKVDVEIV
ncbi:Hsp20/alpha crystallin family protein [uncultured Methanosphaera sp.]|uniref:Hsp20/alpha crystallin family protein n=1 Tax=uncultured Methanosphaera sp. TaxID=262501 RepID=UPI0025CE3432|nr:Hsp20/alpha crystallin family protein [uncultured Methanosphaera sp.]